MMNFEKTYKRHILNESRHNYGIRLEGLQIDPKTIKITNYITKTSFEEPLEGFEYSIQLKPCVLDKWSASEYYSGGVSSDGIWYNDFLQEIYTDDDKRVEGGEIRGYMDKCDVDDFINERTKNYRSIEKLSQIPKRILFDCIEACNEVDLTIDMLEWSYDDDNNIIIKSKEYQINDDGDYNYQRYLTYAKIVSPNISANIQWYFDNWYRLDEVFGEEDEDEVNDDFEEDEED